MTRSDDAPLHERLEALLMRDSTGREITPVFVPAATLREAAAALRPPEGNFGALRSRLRQWAEDCGGQSAADLRAALAHLRRLGQVEAERDRLRAALRDMACLSFGVSGKSALGVEQEFREMARIALAPAPAAEPGHE